MIIPLSELSSALKMIHDTDSGPYDVTFHLSEAGQVEHLYLVARSECPATPEARALKAEMALRRIATVLLRARLVKDFEATYEMIVAIHNAWVADRPSAV